MATNVKNIKVGDTIRVKTDRFASYGYPKGTSAIVTYKSGTTLNVQYSTYGPISMTTADVEVSSQSKADVETELKLAEELVKTSKAKIKWMEETKSEVYDEDEFKVWQVLSTLDAKSSKIDKVRAIAAIIKK